MCANLRHPDPASSSRVQTAPCLKQLGMDHQIAAATGRGLPLSPLESPAVKMLAQPFATSFHMAVMSLLWLRRYVGDAMKSAVFGLEW